LGGEQPSSETIKIGICADLDNTMGRSILQGAKLAAEQVNAEGGVLGMNFEIVAQDDDSETSYEPIAASNAFAKLISVDEADFIISMTYGLMYREIAFEHKKIFFTVFDTMDEFTQGVLDNYDRYKYCFRAGVGNFTAAIKGNTESVVVCRNHTGFNKVAFIYGAYMEDSVSSMTDTLEKQGFDVVLSQPVAPETIDYSSAFAKAEAAGAEILFPMVFETKGIPFVKEYYDRQSPMVMWGWIHISERSDFWQITEGKCEYITSTGYPVVTGYPLTSKTAPTRDAYVERWGEEISSNAAVAYDTIRFVLPDAIERAGTIETEAVIEALEETDVETSVCRRFVFTSSHDIMVGMEGPNKLSEDYFLVAMFQWQDGVQVPVYPTELMEEAGATYIFPDWPGPWDNIS
jgi:branched-chain amino acid transport system substrate-binding protein